jgi:hypothetical protein
MNYYKTCLQELQEILGTQATYASDLNEIGEKLFTHKWGGVFPKDAEDIPFEKYCIINTHNASQPGEHWFAIGEGLLYDSFGRDLRSMIGGQMNITEEDAEQSIEESNCGARCLAWLCVLDNYGPGVALTI